MKIKRSTRLAVVVTLAEKDEQHAAKLVEECRKELQQEQARLSEIQDYYTEYVNRFSSGKTGLRASDIGRQRDFLLELTQMQGKQKEHIARIDQALQQRLQHWQLAHLKHQNLKKLVDRYAHDETRILEKQEQAIMDEWAQQTRKPY